MHNFIIPQFNFQPILSDKAAVHQVNKVLKLKIGEKITVGNGTGDEAVGEILSTNTGQIELAFGAITKNKREPSRPVTLYCAILKKENFEFVVQKATEIGVAEIVPIISAYTVKNDLNLPRLQKIIKEAVEQSGRGVLPRVSSPQSFDFAVKNVKSDVVNWFCDTGVELSSVPDNPNNIPINIFIGPEGGWSPNELTLAKNAGLKFVSLGRTVLRGETAAIVATYLAVNK